MQTCQMQCSSYPTPQIPYGSSTLNHIAESRKLLPLWITQRSTHLFLCPAHRFSPAVGHGSPKVPAHVICFSCLHVNGALPNLRNVSFNIWFFFFFFSFQVLEVVPSLMQSLGQLPQRGICIRLSSTSRELRRP